MHIYAASYLYPVTSPPVAGGAIAIEGGVITDVGPLDCLRKEYGAPVTEYPDCVIMPGLVNAHTHLELTHFPSWKLRKGIDYSPRTYVDWVIQVIKIRRSLTRPELEHSLREGIRVSLECGTTSIGEIVSDRSLVPLYDATELSGRLFLEAIGQEPGRTGALLDNIEKILPSFAGNRLKPGISPHAPHTVSAGFLRELAGIARRYALPAMIHLSESREEAAFMHDSSGKIAELLYPFVDWESYLPSPLRTTSAAWLEQLGVLDSSTSVVHCVHITPDDAQILKKSGATAVLCPRSNERLAVGKAPLHLLQKCGIPLALGTDSLASNDSLSMWDEMRFLASEFPGLLTPDEVIGMATLGGAKAIHLDNVAGSLEKGKRSDFLIVKTDRLPSVAGLAEALIEESRLLEVFVGGKAI
ncbi:MAG TPA: amidohydrolase family protein [Geobacteraceae bacterium]|nr:amidohydrolase family protein [Geobacteraceae bacterium]